MMRLRHRFAIGLIVLAVLFTTYPAHAEEGRLSIRTLAVEKVELPSWHVATDGGAFTELQWPVEQPSAIIQTTADHELVLFAKANNAEGKEEFNVARKLAIPVSAKQMLLVAWPVNGGAKVELMVVPDDLKQADFHNWMVINTSTQVVTLRCGANSEAIQLDAVEAKSCRINTEQGLGSAVLAQAKVKNEWKTIYSTYWAAPEKQRSLVLFYDKDKMVKLRRVIDILEAAE